MQADGPAVIESCDTRLSEELIMSNVHHAGAKSSKRYFTRKKWIALGILGIFALGGAAYAYFTTTGSGTGTAQVGTSSLITVNATVTPDASGLVPGGIAATVNFAATNPSAGHQRVGTITLATVTAYTDVTHAALATGCDTTKFTMTPVVSNEDVPTAGPTTLSATGTLVFVNNPSASQDACKNANLQLTFTNT